MGSRAVALGALWLAGLATIAPVGGNGNQPHAVPGILFPDCHSCPAPLSEPRQNGTLRGAPPNYTPETRYDMALDVVPYRGQVSRFALTVTSGKLEAVERSTRVLNFSQLPYANSLPQVRDFVMLTYHKPLVDSVATWRFQWTAPPAGTGPVTFAFYTMSGLEDGVKQKDAWRLEQVKIPEGAPSATPPSEAPFSTPPRLEPAFLSPPPPPSPASSSETPRPSPGFELLAALAALAMAAKSRAPRKPSRSVGAGLFPACLRHAWQYWRPAPVLSGTFSFRRDVGGGGERACGREGEGAEPPPGDSRATGHGEREWSGNNRRGPEAEGLSWMVRLPLVGLIVVLSLCAGPSPAPSSSPLPGSPGEVRLPEPPRHLLPAGARPAGYEPVNPAAYDPRFLASELGAVPARFEDLPYLTADRLRFVHIQVADFNDSAVAGAAYRNYTATFPEGLCPNRSSLDLGAENLLCDNRGRGAGSHVAAREGASLLVAFTHDGNRTPFGDLEALARRTLETLGGP